MALLGGLLGFLLALLVVDEMTPEQKQALLSGIVQGLYLVGFVGMVYAALWMLLMREPLSYCWEWCGEKLDRIVSGKKDA